MVPKLSERPLLETTGLFIRKVYREVLLFEDFSTKFPLKGLRVCEPELSLKRAALHWCWFEYFDMPIVSWQIKYMHIVFTVFHGMDIDP